MPVTLAQFVRDLTGLGLLSTDELRAQQAKSPELKPNSEDAKEFARALVDRQVLTAHQARLLYDGRGADLVYGNYLILDRLGEGAMGLVYKARHQRMQRVVALKMMSARAMQSADAIRRFRREVEAAGRLIHPNIVSAFDADEANGVQFFAMEYVDGSNLAALVKQRGTLAVWQAVHILVDAARGLDHAHAAGVIHRDIKPANLLMDRKGQVKVLDMGLARIDESLSGLAAGGEALTRSGSILGTVDYMSPEQAQDTRRADRRSDIYSLGCTLHYLLTGRAMYHGETLMAIVLAHRTSPPPSLQAVRDDVPDELETLFHRLVAKNPDDRPPTMAHVVEALQRVRDRLGHTSTITELPGSTLLALNSNARAAGEPRQSTVDSQRAASTRSEQLETPAAALSDDLPSTRDFQPARLEWERHSPRRTVLAAGFIVVLALACVPWVLSRRSRHSPSATGTSRSTRASVDPGAIADPLIGERDEFAGGTVTAADGWVDLSRRIQFPRDSLTGDWRLAENTLAGDDSQVDAQAVRLILPVEPQGSYEIAFRFRRARGEGSVNVVLPIGSRAVTLAVAAPSPQGPNGKPLTGLETLDGKKLAEAEATIDTVSIINHRAYRLKVAVHDDDRQARIAVELDDDEVLSWQGGADRLGQSPAFQLPDPRRPGLAVFDAACEFHDLEFRVISGSAVLGDIAAPTQPTD